MNTDDNRRDTIDRLRQTPVLQKLLKELGSGLARYFETAAEILEPCGVCLKPPGEAAFGLRRNFFSLLFLYSYRRMGIAGGRRILYAATLQCLRGMVTGCDNLLDDEYKSTLETDIPATGYRFRSVVDIMVSDRVLFWILSDAARRQEIDADRVLAASTASMQTITRSGVQEASEEAGVDTILTPAAILQTVHHYKTGILFQCAWDIPRTIETVAERDLKLLLEALYRIGIGCQIMDDMVDLGEDIRARKHNYLVSLIRHGLDPAEKAQLAGAISSRGSAAPEAISLRHFPHAWRKAWETSRRWLTSGLNELFLPQDRMLVVPAIRFLEQRIGVHGPQPETSA